MPAERVVEGVDGCIVTHFHKRSLRRSAASLLDPGIPILTQPEASTHSRPGLPVGHRRPERLARARRRDHRRPARDRRAREALGPVSGFVLDGVYVAGDTIWCDEVRDAVERHRPRAIVVNGGGARFLEGDPIVMTADDVRAVREAPTRPSWSSTSRRSTTASSRDAPADRRGGRAARRRSRSICRSARLDRDDDDSASASDSVVGREVRVRDGDDAHARRLRRADAVVRVLDRAAARRVDAEPAGRLEVDVRRRLAARHLLRRDGRREVCREAGRSEHDVDQLGVRRRRDRERQRAPILRTASTAPGISGGRSP